MKPQSSEQNRGYRLFVAAWILYAGYYVCRKDLGTPMGAAQAHFALELGCFGIAYAIGNLVSGSLSDLRSARRTAIVGAGISILCTALLAWAPAPFEVLLQLGNGFGQGFGWPSLLKLIAVWFGQKNRDRALGWWSTSYILVGFLATTFTEWITTRSLDSPDNNFSAVFLAAAAILFGCVLIFAFQTSGFDAADMRTEVERGSPESPANWLVLLRNRSIRYISCVYFLLKMTRYTLLFWLPHYLLSSFGYTSYRATRAASYFEIFGCIGPIAAGYLAQFGMIRNRLGTGAVMLYALAFLCLIHPMLISFGLLGMILSISLMGILIHGADMLLSGMAVLDAVPFALQGRAVGFVNAIGSVGQALSPVLATLFVAYYGWDKLFDLFVFFALMSGSILSVGARGQGNNGAATNPSLLEPPRLPREFQPR
jgi:sugar phosphate permease